MGPGLFSSAASREGPFIRHRSDGSEREATLWRTPQGLRHALFRRRGDQLTALRAQVLNDHCDHTWKALALVACHRIAVCSWTKCRGHLVFPNSHVTIVTVVGRLVIE